MIVLPLLLAGYAVWCGLAYVLQDQIIFAGAFGARPVTGNGPPRGVERVWIENGEGGRTEGWFLRGTGRSAARPGPAVIFTHGNGELIDDWPAPMRPYAELGLSVLLAEYRGYGRSGGRPSQAGIVADLEAFHDWLAARPEVDRHRIVLHGRSLGGGVAAALAERRPPAALILESTFTGLAAFFSRFAVPGIVCRHPFETARVLAALDRPVLIFHGSRDGVIPVEHGRQLQAVARRATYVEMDAGHNDFPPDPQAYWTAIRRFLHDHRLLARGESAGAPLPLGEGEGEGM